ncbi:MAG: MlaD family protein [Sandaracinaceae bacterium]
MGLSLEARVGLLVLAAAVLLGGFLFALGGFSFERSYPVYVDFENPGAVKVGAPVRIGGVQVGTVEDIEYWGRRLDPATGRRPLVRIELSVHENIEETVHRDALFYVTSQGVLGEAFIAIDPGNPDSAPLEEGAVVAGEDPPRLDLAFALAYELLDVLVRGLREHGDVLGQLLEDVVALVHQLRAMVEAPDGDLAATLANVRVLTEESILALRGAREAYIDGERPRRIMANVDRTMAAVGRETPQLLVDLAGVAQSTEALLETFGPEEREQIRTAIASASRTAAEAETATHEAAAIIHRLSEGEGTVGALLMDEELYDDIQELVRDLKHNPWRLFWRQ